MLPLLTHDAPSGRAFALSADGPVTREAFLAHVKLAADRLPEAGRVINMCEDNYHFAVAFSAILVRGGANLLPPDRTPYTLARAAELFPDSVLLGDGKSRLPGSELPVHELPPFPEAGSGGRQAVPAIAGDHEAAILFTSGSTGQPTAHSYSWADLAALSRVSFERLEMDPAGWIVATVPPQHMYGLEFSILWALQGGMGLQAARPFYPVDVRDRLAEAPGPRMLVTTPVHLKALLDADLAWPEVDGVLSATAPLTAELAQAAEETLGAHVWEVYGCTEGGSLAMRRTARDSLWGWHPGMAVQAEDGGDAVYAPHLGRSVPLGDDIEVVGEDRFRLRGRKEDRVNVAGKRASLADLNERLVGIPGVKDGIFLTPEQTGSGRLGALVVAPDLGREELLQALTERLDTALLPRPIHFLDALPRNDTGKLPRSRVDTLLRELRGK